MTEALGGPRSAFPTDERFAGTRAAELTSVETDALGAYLGDRLEGFGQLRAVRRFNGGQSNPTFLVVGEHQHHVLRSKPAGELLASAHAIEREFKMLEALHPAGFPVPRPLLYCRDTSLLGAEFYVMSHVAGRSFWNFGLPTLAPAARARIFDALVVTLARLHALSPDAIGLGTFGRGDDYVVRQIARWSSQFRASQAQSSPVMEELAAALAATVPSQSGNVLVHGDFRLDNLLFDDRERVVAVLDWELSTLGDPMADLSYLLMHWCLPADGGTMIGGLPGKVAGIPTVDAVAARYGELTGRNASAHLDWYLAYNLFRAACVCEGIAGRVRNGTAASPAAAEVAQRAPGLLAAAARYAGLAGIAGLSRAI